MAAIATSTRWAAEVGFSKPFRVGGTVERTNHRLVKVPTTNLEHEALKEALSREVQLNPDHQPIINRVLHAAKQLMHGEEISTQEVKAGIGWKD